MADVKAGQVYGHWTVLVPDAGRYQRRRLAQVRCTCGTVALVRRNKLHTGETQSCGCVRLVVMRRRSPRGNRVKCPEYGSWRDMLHRCLNPKRKKFPIYGGRGIRVCEAWQADFETFLRDVGPRPGPGYSLDRIDPNGHYEPGNVRWATVMQQRVNTRRQLGRGRILPRVLPRVLCVTVDLAAWAETRGR